MTKEEVIADFRLALADGLRDMRRHGDLAASLRRAG
jgi:hypothetical protein